MKHLMFSILGLLFIFTVNTLNAQSSPVGIWKTIDDKTGNAKSHVEIYEQGGKYYGKVIKLLLKSPDTVCEKCTGSKKNKPVMGMVVMTGMEKYKDYWKNGEILDPESGNTYGCSIWFENGSADELKVRGKHLTGLYRTQTWYRVK
jgi:uncharacterized protein (DUF2147 family)